MKPVFKSMLAATALAGASFGSGAPSASADDKELALRGLVDCGKKVETACDLKDSFFFWTSDITGETARFKIDITWIKSDRIPSIDQEDELCLTGSMREAIAETERRREVQGEYNRAHGITPESVRRSIRDLLESVAERDYYTVEVERPGEPQWESPAALAAHVAELETAMKDAARRLDFERAAELRDRIKALRKVDLGV